MKQIKPSVGKRIVQGLEEFATALENKAGRIADRFTCHVIELDLQPSAYGPEEVRQARKVLGASQMVFARFLGVSVKTVRAWEQGVNTPQDVACRFMDEIKRDPKYWLKRLKESAVVKSPQ
jgi:putative transcriptional regulator